MGTDLFLSIINQTLSEVQVDLTSDMPVLIVDSVKIVDVLRFLMSHSEFSFKFLTDLCGVHYPDMSPPQLAVVYHLHDLVNNMRIRVKTFLPVEAPSINTVSHLFASANWMERETYDFFGIQFEGHPNLVRILNMDDMAYFPMRKEFKLEDSGRTDKNDAYFGR